MNEDLINQNSPILHKSRLHLGHSWIIKQYGMSKREYHRKKDKEARQGNILKKK